MVKAEQSWLLVALLLLALGLGCDRADLPDKPGGPGTDTTRPDAIELSGEAADGETSVTLSWSAPGDDGGTGGAGKAYDLRLTSDSSFSGKTAFEAGWESLATWTDGMPVPAAPGTRQSVTVTGLETDTVYFFGLRAADEVPNWSLLHSVLVVKTGDETAPGTVSHFTVTDPGTGNLLDLTWRNPADDDLAGVMVRRQTGTAPAGPVDGDLVCDSGTGKTPACDISGAHKDEGLVDGTEYHYAAFAYDDESTPNHASAEVASGTPTDSLPPLALATFAVTRSATPYALDLAWTQPVDQHDDLSGILILRFEVEPDASTIDPAVPPAGATVVLDDDVPTRVSFADQGLLEGQEYWYLVFPKDEVPNHGPFSQGSGIAQAGSGDDTTRPDPIELFGTPGQDQTSVTLSWMAPGDDGGVGGPAQEYDLRYTVDPRYSSKAAFAAAFSSLPQWTENLPAPLAPGEGQSVTVTRMMPDTTYYFVLRAADEVPNWSLVDEVLAVKTMDLVPPGAVTAFTVTDPATGGRLELAWVAPTDADLGEVQLIRKVGADPTELTDGELVCRTGGTPSCDTTTSHGDAGLVDGAEYHYAAYAFDDEEVPNVASPAFASGVPTDTVAPALLKTFVAVNGGTGSSVLLSWTLPDERDDLQGVLVLRRDDQYPSAPDDALAQEVYNGPDTSRSDLSVVSGKTYYYAAYTHDDTPNYSGSLTAQATVTGAGGTEPVTDLVVANPATGNQIDLTWTDSQTASVGSVRIVRFVNTCIDNPDSIAADFKTDAAIAGASLANSWSDTNDVLDNTTYCYMVYANASGQYSASATGTATCTDITPPDPVLSFTASNTGVGDSIEVTWQNPAVDYEGCVVRRREGRFPTGRTDGIGVYSGEGTGFTDGGLTAGTEYFYAAWSHDDSSPNNWSVTSAQSSETCADTTAPGQVTSFTVTAEDDGTISLSWQLPSPPGDYAGVKILRRADRYAAAHDEAGAEVVHNGTGTSTTDAGVVPATRYFYSAFAFDEALVYTAAVQNSDITRCGRVSNLALENEVVASELTGNVLIGWDNPADTEFFAAKVLRKLGDYPSGPEDGSASVICDEAGEAECVDGSVVMNERYYYAVYAHNAGDRFALPVQADILAVDDLTAPEPVTGLTATPDLTPGARAIDLSWTNPADVDLQGVRVLKRADAYPESPTDSAASVACDVDAAGCRDEDVEDGVEYRFRAWAYDEVPNWSAGADALATRPYIDDDEDGYTEAQGDCNDRAANLNPDEIEICDGLDNDCENGIDDGFDGDGDFFTRCGTLTTDGSKGCVDCDDSDGNNQTDCGCFLSIPAGSFWMGSPDDENCPAGYPGVCAYEEGWDEEYLHEVTLTRGFIIQQHEVTQGEFETVTGWNPSNNTTCGTDCPVERVTWFDAVAYMNQHSLQAGYTTCYVLSDVTCWVGGVVTDYMDCVEPVGTSGIIKSATVGLNGVTSVYDCEGYRLPTEAEWEYAYRAGSNTALYPSDGNDGTYWDSGISPDPNVTQIGWYVENSGGSLHAVGGKEGNAWGLHDMAGNVSEWTWDLYQAYLGESLVSDPEGPAVADDYRVVRNSSWHTYADMSRAASRFGYRTGGNGYGIGFRAARTEQ